MQGFVLIFWSPEGEAHFFGLLEEGLVFWGRGWSSGGGAHSTGSQQNLSKESITSRPQWGRACCKLFGQPVLVLSCLLKLVYAERQGREMAPASFFVPGEESSCLLLSGKPFQKSE